MKVSKEIKNKMSVIRNMLEVNGLLNDADEVNLQLLENEFVLYEKATEAIDEYGVLITDSKGCMKPNPATSIRNKASNTILAILKEFGISTKSRKILLEKPLDEHEETALTAYMKQIK